MSVTLPTTGASNEESELSEIDITDGNTRWFIFILFMDNIYIFFIPICIDLRVWKNEKIVMYASNVCVVRKLLPIVTCNVHICENWFILL
jgi:hypothetical protein